MPGQLSVNERVLLHLSRFATDTPPEEYPAESTQVGIAEGVGISRTHVPRAVKALIKEGLVEELRGRVAERERRMSVYAVTPEGFRKADEAWGGIRLATLSVRRDGRVVQMEGKALEEMLGRKQAMGLISRMKDGIVELLEKRRTPVRDLLRAPSVEEFYGREKELNSLDAFLESDASVAVVLGNRGYGTTTLVGKFLKEHEEADAIWLPVREHMTPDEVESALVSFAKRISPEVADIGSALSAADMIVVFDGYHMVSDEMVEFFTTLAHPSQGTKLIITAREDTPAYNWFYQKKHVESGIVREIRVRGLDETSARKLLGNPNIEGEAFRRIYLMTRGQPLLLRMLRENDSEGLKVNSVYTAEEIRYLLFLKDKTD